MIPQIHVIKYWQDRSIIDLPAIDSSRIVPFPRAVASPSRISFAILPYKDIINPLLSTISLQTNSLTLTAPSDQKTCLATFSIDEAGMPVPSTALLHISLIAIKTQQIEGDLQKLGDYHQKATNDFRQKLANGKPIDSDRLHFLLDWLQSFLPRGCDFTHEFVLDIEGTTSHSWPPMLSTLPQKPSKIQGPLRGYINFLLGIDQVSRLSIHNHLTDDWTSFSSKNPVTFWWGEAQPATWPSGKFSTLPDPLKSSLIAAKQTTPDSNGGFFALTTDGEQTRTAIVKEFVAQHLVSYAQRLPERNSKLARIAATLADRPADSQAGGIVVFSADANWLKKLERVVTLSPIDNEDPLLRQQLAARDPQMAMPFLDALTRQHRPDSPLQDASLFQAMDAAYRIKRQLDERDRLRHKLKYLASMLKDAEGEQPKIEEQLAAIDRSPKPKELLSLERKTERLKHAIAGLKKRLHDLTVKRTQFRQSNIPIPFAEAETLLTSIEKLKQSIQQRESEVVEINDEVTQILERFHTDLKIDREILSIKLSEQIIAHYVQLLNEKFDKKFLQTYRCFTIKAREDIATIIDNLQADSFEISKTWAIPSAKAIRGFITHAASAYRTMLDEYENLASQTSHTPADKKRLLTLHKHFFTLHPVRLIPLDCCGPYLNEIEAGKLQLAIIDGTTPPHYLLLAQICQRFNKVILLDGKREHIVSTGVPQPLTDALRQKHHLIDLPAHL